MTSPVSHSPGQPVGLIGTGSMGAGIGRNLLRAGHALHLFARRSDAAQPLVQAGATACASPADLGQHCRLVVLSLTDAAAVEAVLFGPLGLASTLAPGSVVVDTSTIAATSARALADRLAAQGVWLLDAPVSGGQAGAEAGTLGCMVGGAAEVLDACRETLGAFCKTITHVGPQGAGQTVKACNQVAVAGAMLGVADAMALAKALAKAQGVDPALMREVLLGGTARTFSNSSGVSSVMRPSMAVRNSVITISAAFCSVVHARPLPSSAPRWRPMASSTSSSCMLGHCAGRPGPACSAPPAAARSAAQVVQQLQRHLFLVVGIAANGAAGRQVEAALRHHDARPQHAGRVVQVKVVGQRDALLQLGDAGFVAGLGLALVGQRVDERGLAHVGHAADQHPHGLGHAAAVGRQLHGRRRPAWLHGRRVCWPAAPARACRLWAL
jgi:3-hydroxyisobutyrate dehydrogenase-like beta-hydroxyacid dehydrogenase